MATPENTQISSAQQFKKRREAREQGDVLTLSSGLVVRLIRPEITKMIAKGLMPSSMVQTFMAFEGKTDKAVKAEDIEAILGFQRVVAVNAVVEPKVVEQDADYDANEINVDDLEAEDLSEIWAFANGGSEAVELFRKERDSRLSVGLDSETLPE